MTLVELLIALGAVSVVLAAALPTLSHGRIIAHRERCRDHLVEYGVALETYRAGHDDAFPLVLGQPAWHYAGVRFSAVDGRPLPDHHRPLTPYLALGTTADPEHSVFECPADTGITGDTPGVGTGDRTAYRAFGISYRANEQLFGGRPGADDAWQPVQPVSIVTVPSRLVVLGDPVWFETWDATGRHADWHSDTHAGNVLFLDGAVRYQVLRPRAIAGPAVVEPKWRE